MTLTVQARADESGAFDILSGSFKVGVIRPLAASDVAPAACSWAITTVMIGGKISGVAMSIEQATADMLARWRAWLREAELAVIDAAPARGARVRLARTPESGLLDPAQVPAPAH